MDWLKTQLCGSCHHCWLEEDLHGRRHIPARRRYQECDGWFGGDGRTPWSHLGHSSLERSDGIQPQTAGNEQHNDHGWQMTQVYTWFHLNRNSCLTLNVCLSNTSMISDWRSLWHIHTYNMTLTSCNSCLFNAICWSWWPPSATMCSYSRELALIHINIIAFQHCSGYGEPVCSSK